MEVLNYLIQVRNVELLIELVEGNNLPLASLHSFTSINYSNKLVKLFQEYKLIDCIEKESLTFKPTMKGLQLSNYLKAIKRLEVGQSELKF